MTHHHHPTVPDRPMSRRALLQALAASSVAVGAGALAVSPAAAATGSTAAAAAAGGSAAASGRRLVPLGRIGVQLFTIRDKVNSVGFRGVFEELASIGYTEVEFAGYTQGSVGPITLPEIRQLLDDNGLKAIGSHVNPTPANIDREIENAHILGMPHFGKSTAISNVNTVAGWTQAAQTWNEMGAKAKAAGLKMYAHNHLSEWAFTSDDPTRRVYDLLWDEFDPHLVYFEMDLFFAFAGKLRYPGFDPLDYVTRDPRRFPLLHLKDGKLNPNSVNGYDQVEFGAGDMPYHQFLDGLRGAGQHAALWEQNNANSWAPAGIVPDSFGAAQRSYDRMASMRG